MLCVRFSFPYLLEGCCQNPGVAPGLQNFVLCELRQRRARTTEIVVWRRRNSSGATLNGDCFFCFPHMASYNRSLTIVTGLCSAMSLSCLCIGLVTDGWLYAAERLPLDDSSSSTNFTYRNTTSGLWRKCIYDREYEFSSN